MLTENIIKILGKVYQSANGTYDSDKELFEYSLPKTLSSKQRQLVAESGFLLNNIVQYQHDTVIKQLKEIAHTPYLESKVKRLFLKAIGEGFHRGLQPVFSFYFAKNMPLHTYEPCIGEYDEEDKTQIPCKISGIPLTIWQNDSENLYDLYTGYCRLYGCTELLLDLQEVVHFADEPVSETSLNTFHALIDCIKKADARETPSALEKRLSAAKLLPKSTHTSRTWLIRILAELGILPNTMVENYSIMTNFYTHEMREKQDQILSDNAPNHRVEVYFPISAWRGYLGVDDSQVQAFLNHIE